MKINIFNAFADNKKYCKKKGRIPRIPNLHLGLIASSAGLMELSPYCGQLFLQYYPFL